MLLCMCVHLCITLCVCFYIEDVETFVIPKVFFLPTFLTLNKKYQYHSITKQVKTLIYIHII